MNLLVAIRGVRTSDRRFRIMPSKFNTASRRTILTAALGIGLTVGLPWATAQAFNENSPADINVDAQGVVLRGYDAVAYQTEKKAVQGSAAFSAKYGDATYHFASAANRDTFNANPARYAPAYGGFCAMGVAMGRKLDGDPKLFRVVDNRLFLNVNETVQARWVQEIPDNVKKAETVWPSLKGKTPKQTNT